MLIKGSKYEFRISNWPKIGPVGAFRAIKIPPKNQFCSLKTTLTSPQQIFFEVRPPKDHQNGPNAYLLGDQNTNLGSQNC